VAEFLISQLSIFNCGSPVKGERIPQANVVVIDQVDAIANHPTFNATKFSAWVPFVLPPEPVQGKTKPRSLSMSKSRFSRLFPLALTACVAVIALNIGVHATQTITTPNAAKVTYNLAAGASSAAVNPVENTPVLVMGVQTNLGYRGVGQVSMLHIASSFLEWAGIESPASATITSGFSGTAGTHIVYLDYSHLVDIQVASTDTFIIHNANTIAMAGVVTLIW
jgi:hypothetical protein